MKADETGFSTLVAERSRANASVGGGPKPCPYTGKGAGNSIFIPATVAATEDDEDVESAPAPLNDDVGDLAAEPAVPPASADNSIL